MQKHQLQINPNRYTKTSLTLYSFSSTVCLLDCPNSREWEWAQTEIQHSMQAAESILLLLSTESWTFWACNALGYMVQKDHHLQADASLSSSNAKLKYWFFYYSLTYNDSSTQQKTGLHRNKRRYIKYKREQRFCKKFLASHARTSFVFKFFL